MYINFINIIYSKCLFTFLSGFNFLLIIFFFFFFLFTFSRVKQGWHSYLSASSAIPPSSILSLKTLHHLISPMLGHSILSSFFPLLLWAPLAFWHTYRFFIQRSQITLAYSVNLTFYKYIFDFILVGLHVNVIYTNFTKAFDSVNHDSLISYLALPDFLLLYDLGYVLIFSIDLNGSNSLAPSKLSLLLPLMFSRRATFLFCFLLFVNNVNTVYSHSKIICFADDIKLYCKVSSIEYCHCLQRDLDYLVI